LSASGGCFESPSCNCQISTINKAI
jgi:hypothetical protein